MAVPYTFSDMSAAQGISLSLLDANFAAVNVNAQIQMEKLTVTVQNTLPQLAHSYSGILFMLILNGVVFCPVGTPAPFTVVGKNITWTDATYTIFPGDSVVVIYSYNG